MRSLNRNLARASMLAIALLLTACGASSPPIVQTQSIKELPPAALLDCPAPVLPPSVATRDQERSIMLDVAAWGAKCKAQLDAVRQWETQVSK